MTILTRGANTAIAESPATVTMTGVAPHSVDIFVFQLDDNRKVRSDDDLVFFNNPTSADGTVSLDSSGQVHLDLGAVSQEVRTVVIAVSVDDRAPGPLSATPAFAVTLSQSDAQTITAVISGLTTERSAVLLEVYRRGGSWKARNVSAGWDGGLVALVTEHGVSVDEPLNASAQPRTVKRAQLLAQTEFGSREAVVNANVVRTIPAEAKLSLKKRQKLDLRKKEVAKVLLSKDARGYVGRVILVIDKTGSMSRRYSSGEVAEIVRRMVPVATQLDSDGQLEAYLYGLNFARLPDVTVDGADEWIDQYIHLRGKHGGVDYDRQIGGVNDEIPVMSEIISSLDAHTNAPTLILFFTDGGFSKQAAIQRLMRQASLKPAFWQFIGIGHSGFGVLENLDTLSGRVVDNAGFFSVDNVDNLSDRRLYELLLSEYPDWLRAARAENILR